MFHVWPPTNVKMAIHWNFFFVEKNWNFGKNEIRKRFLCNPERMLVGEILFLKKIYLDTAIIARIRREFPVPDISTFFSSLFQGEIIFPGNVSVFTIHFGDVSF